MPEAAEPTTPVQLCHPSMMTGDVPHPSKTSSMEPPNTVSSTPTSYSAQMLSPTKTPGNLDESGMLNPIAKFCQHFVQMEDEEQMEMAYVEPEDDVDEDLHAIEQMQEE